MELISRQDLKDTLTKFKLAGDAAWAKTVEIKSLVTDALEEIGVLTRDDSMADDDVQDVIDVLMPEEEPDEEPDGS